MNDVPPPYQQSHLYLRWYFQRLPSVLPELCHFLCHQPELLVSLSGSHSVIVVEHDMDFVRQIARKVTVLHQGHVLSEGTMDQVQSDPKVIEVYLGAE